MAATTLAEITRLDLNDLSTTSPASISDIQQLSSYNWIESSTPTIAVPGSPPLWTASKAPKQVKKDSGLVYIAQNAARHPSSPLEPLFRALYIIKPSFDIQPIDVVTDRNNIRKLLSFVNPASSRNGLEPFTFKIEIVNNTAIFCRDENLTQEFIGPREFKGFGHEFEKAYTKSQVKGSTGHHRIITYRFSNLNMIVRHETDGYVDDGTLFSSPQNDPQGSDSLSNMLGSLSLSPSNDNNDNAPQTSSTSGSKLTIKEVGKAVPLLSNLEIKTRVSHKPLDLQEIAPQLWISQTLKLVRAYHQRGTFSDPKVEDVAAAIKTWEETNQSHLKKLAALIKHIVKVLKAGSEEEGEEEEAEGEGGIKKAVVRYDDKTGKLLIIKTIGGPNMLPDDLYRKWDDNDNDKGKAEAEAETTVVAEAGNKDTEIVKADVPIQKPDNRTEGKSSIRANPPPKTPADRGKQAKNAAVKGTHQADDTTKPLIEDLPSKITLATQEEEAK